MGCVMKMYRDWQVRKKEYVRRIVCMLFDSYLVMMIF
jgi:hypothetical protein